MACSTSLVAVCCSNASCSSRLLACSASNSRVFSMAITAWSAKVFNSSTWVSVNGIASRRTTLIAPIALSPLTSAPTGLPVANGTRALGTVWICDAVLRVGYGDHPTLEQRAGRQGPFTGRGRIRAPDDCRRLWRRATIGGHRDHLAVETEDDTIEAITQSRRALSDRLEYRLHSVGEREMTRSTSAVAASLCAPRRAPAPAPRPCGRDHRLSHPPALWVAWARSH